MEEGRKMASFEVEETTIADVHEAYRSGRFTCVDVTTAYLDRIETLNPKVNAYVTIVDREKVLKHAAELDENFARTGEFTGPLHGIPYAIKDQAETAGIPTSFGSKALEGYVPSKDATIVTKLRESGAILLGKLTMPDFAASWWGYGSVHGITRSPYDLERDSGGSSGGTGSAVAANLCCIGIGEDTGGSIRLPSSINNLCGLRVTPGMISRNGLSPLLVPLDTAGPMTRTIKDLATVLDVLVGYDPLDPYTAINKISKRKGSYTEFLEGPGAMKGARFGIIKEAFGDDGDVNCAEVNEVIRSAMKTMEENGAEFVVELSIPDLMEWLEKTSLYFYRSKSDVNKFLKSRASQLRYSTINSIYESGQYDHNLDLIAIMANDSPDEPEDNPDYYPSTAKVTEFQRLLMGFMAEHDLDGICHPALRILPPTHEEAVAWEALKYPTNTVIASQSLIPSICVPAGFTKADGLPVGMEIIAPPYHEGELIRLGHAFEQITQWRKKPDL